MPFQRYTSSSARTNLTRAQRWDGSKWVDIQSARRFDGSGWITFWTSYNSPTVSVNPSSVTGSSYGASSPPNITTTSTTATASGGTGNYTYTWERVSGSTLFTVTAPNHHITAFGISYPPNGTTSATYRCRVSDGVTTVYSSNVLVSATFTWSDGGGPIEP